MIWTITFDDNGEGLTMAQIPIFTSPGGQP